MLNNILSQEWRHKQTGVVLPVALILLLVLTIAGLTAAKRANTHDAITQNLRVSNVAQQSAESALRYCEAVVIDMVDNAGVNFAADASRVGKVGITSPEFPTALWLQPANWTTASPNRILAPLNFAAAVSADSRAIPPPQCIAEPMTNKRYLITARGFSVDATFGAGGRLATGAEVWLQSILSPQIPVQSAGGGNG